MKNIDKIYQIGNFIAAQASGDIPNIGPLLYYIFCLSFKTNSARTHSTILPFILAIEDELSAFEETVNFLGIQSEVLNNFKEKLRIFAEYKHWESSDLFIECAYILFGTEWNIVTIRSD